MNQVLGLASDRSRNFSIHTLICGSSFTEKYQAYFEGKLTFTQHGFQQQNARSSDRKHMTAQMPISSTARARESSKPGASIDRLRCVWSSGKSSPPTREYCNMETFNASCPRANDVVVIRSARYGRMQLGRCVKRNLGYVGCTADVFAVLDSRCSGKRRCEFPIPDPELHATHACPEDTTPYLEVAYECLQGRYKLSYAKGGVAINHLCNTPPKYGSRRKHALCF
jgi:hypothetical protein